MSEQIKERRSFLDYDPSKTAYVVYELDGEAPDFSSYTYGSEHTIVLRNADTGGLERIHFKISGDNGRFFPESRRLWGDIQSDDYNAILVFNFENGKLDKITASFCGKSMSFEAFSKTVEKGSYGAAATVDDRFS